MGHPTFEAGKKMFAVLDRYDDRVCIAFRPSERLQAYLADDRFFARPMPPATAGSACTPMARSTGRKLRDWFGTATGRLL